MFSLKRNHLTDIKKKSNKRGYNLKGQRYLGKNILKNQIKPDY